MSKAISVLILNFVFLLNIHAKEVASFSTKDIIVSKGENSEVSIRLKGKNLFGLNNLKDVPVRFSINDEIIGTVNTNKKGKAKIKIPNKESGIYTIDVEILENKKVKEALHSMALLVLDKKDKIAISDIDHTLSGASNWEILAGNIEQMPILPYAVEAMEELVGNFKLIYLTARERLFAGVTKEWLAHYQFPKAPVIFWELGFRGVPWDHGKYKAEVIANLKNRFDNILVGFGDKPHDVKAYRDNGLRAYYIGDSDAKGIHSEAIQLSTWQEIMAHMGDYPIGELESDPEVKD